MKLKKVLINGFRSIQTAQELNLDDLVTVLIGANDHGKSNVLQAILMLNKDTSFTEDDRHWDVEDDELPRIEWHFILSVDDVSKLAGIVSEDEEDAEEKTDEVEEVETETKVNQKSKAKAKAVTKKIGEAWHNWKLISSRTELTAVYVRSGVAQPVSVSLENLTLTQEQTTALLEMRPRIELFDVQQKPKDKIELEQLDDPAFEFMKGIFLKAGIWDSRETLFTQTQRSARQLHEASERLTRVLRSEWEQGKELKWKFEHGGTNGNIIHLRIEDPAVSSSYVSPSQRSAGFTSFFILSLTVFARTASTPEQSFIYLFDEPGTYLHPLAQVNLQRVFERLTDRAQIIYATHSIFLVNKNVPTRNRVIKKLPEGTVIDRKPFSGNWKAVRESLGIFLSHNFLIADRTLLVEGPSDVIYVLVILHYLIRSGHFDIDLNAFSIEDAGTGRNMVAMAKLMLDEGRNVVILTDGDKHGASIEGDLKKVAGKYIEEEKLTIISCPANSSIEDLLPRRDLWITAIKAACQNLIDNKIRELAEGAKDIGTLVDKFEEENISTTNNKTLGNLLDAKSKEWFKQKESISKLTAAIFYEDALERERADESRPVSAELNNLIEKIIKSLDLPSRKAEELIIEALPE